MLLDDIENIVRQFGTQRGKCLAEFEAKALFYGMCPELENNKNFRQNIKYATAIACMRIERSQLERNDCSKEHRDIREASYNNIARIAQRINDVVANQREINKKMERAINEIKKSQ